MSRSWGKKSKTAYDTLHPLMQKLMDSVLLRVDITIEFGLRSKEVQDAFFAQKVSKVKFPNSRHNKTRDPLLKTNMYLFSDAVDITPYPLGYKATEKDLIQLSKIVFEEAAKLNIKIRWGGDFNMDGDKTKSDSWDKYHYELRW